MSARLGTAIGLTALCCCGLAACGWDEGVGGGASDGAFRGGEDGGLAVDINPGASPLVSLSPEVLGDGWQTSTPDAQGMDGTALQRSLDALLMDGSGGIDGVVIVRNAQLVAEAYFNGFARDSQHDMRSVTKSFTGALAGIAIEQGLIALDDTLPQQIDRFEEFGNVDDRKRSISLAHLLNMQSGLNCADDIPSSPGNETHMYRQEDWIRYILSVPMLADPGTVASYCSGGVSVLGDIVAARSGQRLWEFADENLLNPLGMGKVRWLHSALGVTNASSAIQLMPRDAAKFGSLFLDGGRWRGVQVVPEAWIARSTERVTAIWEEGYGWLWWKGEFDVRGVAQPGMYASGNGGNFIFVLPAERLVVVITASNYNRRSPSMGFFRDGILPTIL